MTKLELAIHLCRKTSGQYAGPGPSHGELWGAIADALESLSSPPQSDTVERVAAAIYETKYQLRRYADLQDEKRDDFRRYARAALGVLGVTQKEPSDTVEGAVEALVHAADRCPCGMTATNHDPHMDGDAPLEYCARCYGYEVELLERNQRAEEAESARDAARAELRNREAGFHERSQKIIASCDAAHAETMTKLEAAESARDAARARVAELEVAMGRVSDNLNCIAHGTNYEHKDVSWCRRELQAAVLVPTPSAPTPAVEEKRFVSGAHVHRHYGVEAEGESPSRYACPVCFKEPMSEGVTYEDGCEKHQESIALDVAKAKQVAPRGLTPAEAEAPYQHTMICDKWRFPTGPHKAKLGPQNHGGACTCEADALNEAYSEGSRAGQAKGALLQKRIDALRAAVRSLGMGSLTRESDARRYLSNDDDLARELGDAK